VPEGRHRDRPGPGGRGPLHPQHWDAFSGSLPYAGSLQVILYSTGMLLKGQFREKRGLVLFRQSLKGQPYEKDDD
jgi:hypothetical protein